MDTPPKMRHWTLNKSISYGDVLVTISLCLGGIVAYFHAEKRISQLEFRTDNIESVLRVSAHDTKSQLKELQAQTLQTQIEVLKLATQQRDRDSK